MLLCTKIRHSVVIYLPTPSWSLLSIMLKPLKIGDLVLPHNVVLAPLAGITNLPFRILCRREGAALAFTEMVSVNGLVREGVNTLALLKSSPDDRPKTLLNAPAPNSGRRPDVASARRVSRSAPYLSARY